MCKYKHSLTKIETSYIVPFLNGTEVVQIIIFVVYKSSAKVVQIIKCTCAVFIDNFRNISTNLSIEVPVCRGSYDACVNYKRNDPMCDPWNSQGNERM